MHPMPLTIREKFFRNNYLLPFMKSFTTFDNLERKFIEYSLRTNNYCLKYRFKNFFFKEILNFLNPNFLYY